MTTLTLSTLIQAFNRVEQPVTITDLAAHVPCSVDEIHSGIDALAQAGFEIDQTADGYRISAVPGYGLGVQYGLAAPFSIEYHDRIGSTNDRAHELATTTTGEWAVLADRQTGGRGRRDRGWRSPSGGIWCSVLLRPELAPDRASLLTLGAAVAVTDAVREIGVEATIKWPNDVMAPDGAKLAGILLETTTTGGTLSWAIIGIGLNAAVDPAALPDGATSLLAYSDDIDRRSLTQTMLEAIDDRRRDLDTIPDAWRRRTSTLGRRVRIDLDDTEPKTSSSLYGMAIDIDETGRLLLETDAGQRRIAVGDCEHLRPV